MQEEIYIFFIFSEQIVPQVLIFGLDGKNEGFCLLPSNRRKSRGKYPRHDI